ncbi:MAG: AraC family transcriptional regulator [Rhodospirillales bacterium]|nr:AraC family transcriptional regulator [Rhodospirillales bacterium]
MGRLVVSNAVSFDVIKDVQTPSCRIDVIKAIYPSPVEMTFENESNLIIFQRPRRNSSGSFESFTKANDFFSIGQVLFIPAASPLRIRADGGPAETLRCSFSREKLSQITGYRDLVKPSTMLHTLNIRERWISESLLRLEKAIMESTERSLRFADALASALLMEISRYLDKRETVEGFQRGGLAPRTLKKIIEYLNENERVTVDDVCELSGYSRRHLGRAFKQATGATIYDAIEEVRFSRASKLLEKTDLRVREIATKVGFSDASSFSVAFQRISGETPSDHRARLRAPAGAVTPARNRYS